MKVALTVLLAALSGGVLALILLLIGNRMPVDSVDDDAPGGFV